MFCNTCPVELLQFNKGGVYETQVRCGCVVNVNVWILSCRQHCRLSICWYFVAEFDKYQTTRFKKLLWFCGGGLVCLLGCGIAAPPPWDFIDQRWNNRIWGPGSLQRRRQQITCFLKHERILIISIWYYSAVFIYVVLNYGKCSFYECDQQTVV